MNDLWKYQLDDFTWTWLGGNFVNNYLGIFDDNGYPDSNNMPGARTGAVGWYDCASQELWVFGGYGYETLRGKESCEIFGMFIWLILSKQPNSRLICCNSLNRLLE